MVHLIATFAVVDGLLMELVEWLRCLLQWRPAGRARSRAVPACSAPLGMLESLPAELLPHLVVGLDAADLAAVATTCSAFAHVVMRDRANDALLWRPVCERRWASKAYDPVSVYPEQLEGLGFRERYIWAERDGKRQLGTGEDLSRVYEWSVKFSRSRAYVIGPFPYRLDGSYISPSFEVPLRYSVKAQPHGNIVIVDGIPDVRMVRRKDWGWELRNMLWVASSMAHGVQPTRPEAMRSLVDGWRRDRFERTE